MGAGAMASGCEASWEPSRHLMESLLGPEVSMKCLPSMECLLSTVNILLNINHI